MLAVRACSSLENTVRVFKTGLNPGHGTGWWSYAWPQPLLPDDVEMYGTRSQRQEWRTAGKVVPYPGDAIGPGGPMSRPIYLADAVEATEPYRHVGSGGGVHTFVIVFAIMDASRLRLMGYELGRDCEVIAPGRLLDGTASWPRAGVKPGSDAQYVKDWHGMIAPIDRKHDEQLPGARGARCMTPPAARAADVHSAAGPKQRKQLRKQAFADAAAARRAAADGDEEYDTDPDEDAAVSEDEGDDDAEADTKAAEKRAPLCSDDFASAPPATAAAAGVSDAEAMFHARVAEGCMREVAIYGDYRQKLIPVAIAIVPLEGMSCTNFGGDHETELQKEMRTFYQFGSGNETELQKEKRAAVQFGSGNETARQKEKRAAVLFGSGEETPLQLDAQFGSGKETPLQLEKRAAVLFGSGEETPLQLEKRAAVLFGSGNETQLQLDAHFGSGKETQRQLDGRAAQFTFLPQATETHQWSCGIGAHEAVYFYAKRGALCAGCTLLYRRGMGPNRRCSRAAASAGGRGAEDTVAEGGAGCADGGPGGGGGGV